MRLQMHLEGSRIVKANNETAFNYFKKSADKVCSDGSLKVASNIMKPNVKIKCFIILDEGDRLLSFCLPVISFVKNTKARGSVLVR